MNKAFRRLGYHINKDGSVAPILLTGRPKPVAPPPPAKLACDRETRRRLSFDYPNLYKMMMEGK